MKLFYYWNQPQLLPAAIVSQVENGKDYANEHKLTYLTIKQIREAALSPGDIADAISAEIPTERAKNTQFHIFRPNISGEEHYAMEIGKIDRNQPTLVRIHSACFTGDVLGSLKVWLWPSANCSNKNYQRPRWRTF